MTERIEKLRKQSLETMKRISPERALLITEFYASPAAARYSVPVQRAMAFRYFLEQKEICINPGELIVGERGPAPGATPTYPEITLHSLKDLEILNSRPKVSFKVDEETRRIYREKIIPFWKGHTNRDRIMNAMDKPWKDAYNAGIFTEFLEQRAPGHTALGDKIYHKGLFDIKKDIRQSIRNLDFYHDPEAPDKREELKAMDIAADAMLLYALRHTKHLEKMAEKEQDKTRRAELQMMAKACRRVPAHAPRTFHEALQYYWFVHLGVISEVNPWDSFSPGRLDQHLRPFYQKEIGEGTLDKEKARELLQCFWVKFNNHPAPPKIGVTALESNTYTDFSLINLGGVTPDGKDAVNELSYLILEVIGEMRMVQPSSMVQVSRKNPDVFIMKALEIIKTGFGQPSVFNTDAIIREMLRQGKDLRDARKGGASGCVETGAFGAEAYFLTGYFNLPKVLEITLHDGINPRTGKKIGISTGDPRAFKSFDELMEAYRRQLNYFIDIKIRGNNIIERINATQLQVPFLSLFIDDCTVNGRDYNTGGARYNTNYIQGVGLGSIADSLTALRYHVYEQKNYSLATVLGALESGFSGFEELQHTLVYETPKFGNDDDRADAQAVRVFDLFYNAVNGRPTPRGGVHRINMLPTTSHVYFGSVTGALPDGRKTGVPLSEGISPVQGSDIHGPTAVIKSASKIDHLRTGGTLLNQKFAPQFFDSPESKAKLTALIRSWFRLDGHHIQFNVVNADTLRDARKHPERYRDLIVRVAGYSDYFNDLGEDLQNEIIRRTEHKGI